MPNSVKAMKRVATGLLILAGIIFVAARLLGSENGDGWLGYVEATAEAAMIGALADWFAVTAIFRHPLNLPIPHTAIVQKRKNEIGRTLGEFVRDNFMTPERLASLVREEELAQRLGFALADDGNAVRIATEGSALIRGITEVLNDSTIQAGLEGAVLERITAVPVAPLAGRAVDWAMTGGHHEALVDSILGGLGKFLEENQATFRARLRSESPWWVPEAIDDRVFDKIYEAINRFITEVGGDPNHELRQQMTSRSAELAQRLKTSPELEARGEELKAELLNNAEVREWVQGLWNRIKLGIIEGSHNPDSEVRQQVVAAISETGRNIESDPQLQATIENFFEGAAGHVAHQGGDMVVNVISSTVESWNAEETTELIEARVGRDLQFIRINGTVVGGLAGLVLHTVSHLL